MDVSLLVNILMQRQEDEDQFSAYQSLYFAHFWVWTRSSKNRISSDLQLVAAVMHSTGALALIGKPIPRVLMAQCKNARNDKNYFHDRF